MVFSKLFRREAIDSHRQRLYGEVILALPVQGWMLTTVILAGLALLAYVLVFGSYARKETVSGWIRPDRGVLRIQTAEESVVESVAVAEGQRVEAGDELMSLRLDADLAKGESLTRRLAGDLEKERQQLLLQAEAVRARFVARTEQLNDELAGLEAQLGQYQRQKAVHEQRAALAGTQRDEQADLVRQGFISRVDGRKLEDSLLAQSQAGEALDQEILGKQNQLRTLRHDKSLLLPEQAAALGSIGEKLALLDQRLTELNRRGHLVKRAPAAGRVAAVHVEAGDAAKENTVLAELLPAGAQLRAELFAPSRATGFLQPGADVQLRYDAFPYQKFGVRKGRVLRVASVSGDARELPKGLALDDPVFRVIVESSISRPSRSMGSSTRCERA